MKLPDSRIEKLVKSISVVVAPELTLEIKQLENRLRKVIQQRDSYRAKATEYQLQLLKYRKGTL